MVVGDLTRFARCLWKQVTHLTRLGSRATMPHQLDELRRVISRGPSEVFAPREAPTDASSSSFEDLATIGERCGAGEEFLFTSPVFAGFSVSAFIFSFSLSLANARAESTAAAASPSRSPSSESDLEEACEKKREKRKLDDTGVDQGRGLADLRCERAALRQAFGAETCSS